MWPWLAGIVDMVAVCRRLCSGIKVFAELKTDWGIATAGIRETGAEIGGYFDVHAFESAECTVRLGRRSLEDITNGSMGKRSMGYPMRSI